MHKHSKETIAYAKELIDRWGDKAFDQMNHYSLSAMSALIMEGDIKGWCSEATGIDNNFWEKFTLPVLFRYLKNEIDAESVLESIQASVIKYFTPIIEELFNNLLGETE